MEQDALRAWVGRTEERHDVVTETPLAALATSCRRWRCRGACGRVGGFCSTSRCVWPPGLPDDADARMDPVPALGEHSSAILAELGYGADEVAALRASGVV
jgi:crotonobetainyl-CoA:carnitine CoA-transferase CaiB-like acyl-CoA transferase